MTYYRCLGEECKVRDTCYRHRSLGTTNLNSIIVSFHKDAGLYMEPEMVDGRCDAYWPLTDKELEIENSKFTIEYKNNQIFKGGLIMDCPYGCDENNMINVLGGTKQKCPNCASKLG